MFFPGSEEWAFRLTEFIDFERACCPFFTFGLVFELGGGLIRLRVRGRELEEVGRAAQGGALWL